MLFISLAVAGYFGYQNHLKSLKIKTNFEEANAGVNSMHIQEISSRNNVGADLEICTEMSYSYILPSRSPRQEESEDNAYIHPREINDDYVVPNITPNN